MKKILTSIIAGAALLLGFASCSGDLHDVVRGEPINIDAFETFELCGAMTEWKNTADTNLKFTKNAEGKYEVVFKALDAEQGFCFITKTGQWDDYQIGGESMAGGTLPDGVTFTSKQGGGKHDDAILSGLTAKSSYKMTVDASTGTYVVSVESSAAAAVPVPFYLDGYYILGSADIGGNATWSASVDTLLWNPIKDRDGNLTYSYTFTAGAAEIEFGIGTKGWGSCYNNKSVFTYGTDTEPKKLAAGNSGNNKVAGLTKGDTYIMKIYTTPDKEVSFSLTVPYYVTIEFNVSGFKAADEGKTAILAGGFCNWGWTSAWGGDKKVSSRANGEIGSDGTAVLKYKVPVEIGQEILIGEFCGYFGEESDDDIATADGEIKSGELDGEGKAMNFKCDYTIKVAGTETYVVSGVTIGGARDVTCAKK